MVPLALETCEDFVMLSNDLKASLKEANSNLHIHRSDTDITHQHYSEGPREAFPPVHQIGEYEWFLWP